MKKWDNYRQAIEDNLLIVDKNQQEIPFKLNKSQLHFLEHSSNRNVILKARKMGFSSVILAIGVIKFLYGKNENIVSMSFDKDAAGKQLQRAKRFIESYEKINKVKINRKYDSKYEMSISFPGEQGYTNYLRVGTAKSTGFGRGDDITFLHLTEVSLADNIDNLLASVGEAVVNDAMITLETTAHGYNSFKTFWDEAAAGHRGYKAMFYNPTWEYSDEYIDTKRQELGKLFDQEYPMTEELAFITSGNTYFDQEALRAYRKRIQGWQEADENQPLSDDKHLLEYRQLEKDEFILIFVDTAWGGGDYCAAQFLSQTKIDIPIVFHKKCLASEMTPIIHQTAERIFNETGVQPVVCIERQNGGVAELDRLSGLNRNQKYRIYQQRSPQGQLGSNLTSKLGWDTSSLTRPVMLSMAKEALDNQFITIYHQPTISEAFSFVEKQTPTGWKPQAESGAHDDLIMALAGVWQMYQTEKPIRKNKRRKRQKHYDKITGRVIS